MEQREIKFRASGTRAGLFSKGRSQTKLVYFELTDLDGNYIPSSGRYLAEDSIVMQFTGLRDKNGKEIYEGDIVNVSYDGPLNPNSGDDEVREVIWGTNDADEYYPAFDLKGHDMETNALSTAKNNGDIEVIGNIYENPELLTNN